ncbi:hypothetical protein DV737_g352, partial [Chaetothyriales sp. CBS 132003]
MAREDEPEEDVDQHTPLLPRSIDARSPFRNPFTGQRLSLSQSLPTFGFPRRSSSSSSSRSDDVDIDVLRLSLAHVGSFTSGTGLEPGRPYYVPDRRPSKVKKADVAPFVGVEAARLLEEDTPFSDSKFIGISPTRFWLVFVVVMLGYFIACFDSTLMASSHPVITSYFGASQAASWLSTVFLITSTAFQPLFGRISDTVGRKSLLLISFAVFGLTTLWCALAGSIESFIAARAMCGIGAGGTMSMSLIIVSDLVRIEDRGVFQSHINLAFGLGSSAGAAFGGYLCDSLGWRWAFGVQVPVIAISLVWAAIFTPPNLGPMLIKAHDGGGAWVALKNFDSLGSLLLVVNVTCLILALNLGGNIYPWLSAVVIVCLSVFVVTAFLFILVEKRAKQPLMPLPLLTRPPVANLIFSNLLGGVSTNTILFNIPLFFQAVQLTSASESGFRLAVPTMIASMAGISTGYIITYTRRLKPTLAFGAIMYLIGSILVSLINKDVSEWLSLVMITGVPLGQGFVFPNTMMSALAVSPQADQAVVTTTIGLWRNLGVVLGVAVSSLVFQNSLTANLEKNVTGPYKKAIIEAVRSSVQAIRTLEDPSQGQVIDAYAVSLRTTFTCAIVSSALVVMLLLPIKLPHLKKGRKIVVGAGE